MVEDKRAKKLEQVRALLAKAADTQFEEEADAFRAKADELMISYAIEEAELRFSDSKRRAAVKPELRTVTIYNDASGGWDLNQALGGIFRDLASLVGVIVVDYAKWNERRVIGWPEDLDYLDILYTGVMMHMISKMDPKGDPKLSFNENVVMLKESGFKWEEVFRRMRSAGLFPADQRWERRIGVKFTGIYTNWCKEHNLPRHYASPDVYRRSFMDGFTGRLSGRIREMRRNREKASEGHGIVLAGRESDLKEFLFELFPDRRPHPADCECDECHYLKCRDLKCTRPNCVAKRKPVKMRRVKYTEPKIDYAVTEAGRKAAEAVDLSGRNPMPGTRKEIG